MNIIKIIYIYRCINAEKLYCYNSPERCFIGHIAKKKMSSFISVWVQVMANIKNSFPIHIIMNSVGWVDKVGRQSDRNLVKDSDSSRVSLNLNILLLVIFYLSFRTLFGFIMLIWSVVASNKFILCCQLLTLFDCCALIKLSESWHFVHCSGLVFFRFLSMS